MSIRKEDIKHLEDLLNAVKDPYPCFTEAIMASLGYLSNDQFFDFADWLENNPDVSTDDVCNRIDDYE